MSGKLGKHQIELLRQLANPWLHLIVADKVAVSLAKRGLIAPRSKTKTGFYSITPKGLRVVADLMDAKVIKFPLPRPKKRRSDKRDEHGS